MAKAKQKPGKKKTASLAQVTPSKARQSVVANVNNSRSMWATRSNTTLTDFVDEEVSLKLPKSAKKIAKRNIAFDEITQNAAKRAKTTGSQSSKNKLAKNGCSSKSQAQQSHNREIAANFEEDDQIMQIEVHANDESMFHSASDIDETQSEDESDQQDSDHDTEPDDLDRSHLGDSGSPESENPTSMDEQSRMARQTTLRKQGDGC